MHDYYGNGPITIEKTDSICYIIFYTKHFDKCKYVCERVKKWKRLYLTTEYPIY